ncbi:hypothetical protein [Bacillus pumilus]|uniref:hypothetical protein n=1 Tax=Bacillus pumilus TaxID=1408 RepID=UPI0011A16175|nr:hypothetical protein [Bacillus pumilus]
MKDLELSLLKLWKDYEFKKIYKYKNRIKAWQGENLANFELFNDLTHVMFRDVEDIANNREYLPEDHAVSIDRLIENRNISG